MFTGIIQEIGTVTKIEKRGPGGRLLIQAPQVLKEAKEGDSIAVNGVCLTISELNGPVFTADLSRESLKRTYLGSLKPGIHVNLEPALRLGDRMGGHLVTGHIDGTAILESSWAEQAFKDFRFSLPSKWRGRIVYKSSIAVDGVSLTVAQCEAEWFSTALIPQTLNSTTLCYKKPGDPVHLELDIISKYIEGVMLQHGFGQSISECGINREFLTKYGY